MSINNTNFINYEQRKTLVRSYLGKTITIKVDRPIGYIHKKNDYFILYPINYGYVPGVLGGDGEELDVYVLGVYEPIEEFTGVVIAIAHREDDIEDKLIVAPADKEFNQAMIAEAVHFQEQYYKTSFECLYHKSCGVILFRKSCGILQYLLLYQPGSKTWSFPKGHMEPGETEEQTALREAFEEVGISVTLIQGFCEEVSYPLYTIGKKTVKLFLAPGNENIFINKDEIEKYKWVDKKTAISLLKVDQYEEVLNKAEKVLNSI